MLHDRIIVISKHDQEAVSIYNVCPSSKVTLIHNGIGEQEFLPRLEAQQELLGDTHPFVIGVIAEWTKNKGLEYLIAAMPAVLKKYPDVNLCLVGWGEESEKLKVQSEKLGIQHAIIFQTKSPAAPYLKAFDIFVLPSLKEGLPYTLLEAGRAELPIISTRVGGIPEIVEDGKNGLLVPPASSQDLADAIIQLCGNAQLRERMRKENRKRIEEKFSITDMLQKTIALYTKQ